MSTEQYWSNTESRDIQPAIGDNNTIDFPYETLTTQQGAPILYYIKEGLVAAGWTVVSCSARVDYNDNATANIFTNGTSVQDIPVFDSSSLRHRYIYDGYTPNSDELLPDYSSSATNRDYVFRDSDSLFKVSETDLWTTASVDDYSEEITSANIYKRIYPGLIRDARTGSLQPSTANSRFKSTYSSAYQLYFNSTGNKTYVWYIPGRAWCLLKAPDNFKEQGSSQNYHILLDYAASPDDGDANPHLTKNNTSNTWTSETFGDYNKTFGNKIGIYVFPSYTDDDALKNPMGEPTPWRRPTHKNEFGIPNPSVVFSSSLDQSCAEMFWLTPSGSSAAALYYVNTIYGISAEGSSDKTGNCNIFVSSNGEPKALLSANNIADPLVKGGVTNAKKYFMFWSHEGRGGGPLGIGSALSTFTSAASPNLAGKNTAKAANLNTLQKTIFDSREAYTHTFYYQTYNSDSSLYVPKRLVSCTPIFLLPPGTNANYQSDTVPAQLFRDSNFAKATVDYTYVEWPLPLLDVNAGRNNYRYAGRMSDVKIGPALGVSGLLAKQTDESTSYDRILFGGLWFGCNLQDALVI